MSVIERSSHLIRRLQLMKRSSVVNVGGPPVMYAVMYAVLCAALAAALFVVRPFAEAAPAASTAAMSALESASLPDATFVEPEAPVPDARFTRAVMGPTTMPGSGVMLDLCRGPVAIDLGDTYPLLIAEHDYCGGSAWISQLSEGDGVQLGGEGVDAGRYVVTEVGYGERRVARFSDMPSATMVLQTCISETKIIMVGLEPVSEARAA